METRKITLRDLLTVTGEEENIALYKACDEGQRFIVKVICSEARLKEVGVRQKHIKHILGKIGMVKEIRKLPNTDDMYAYFVHFRYVNLKAAPGNKKPYYAMLDDMIEPINLEVVGEETK